ncbi:hypothetical protein FQN60_013047 [Etheostoma spectabile]|uniref:Protein sel-1 homolog 3-like n=1 Tax=Etheostoma spectabile TaxID=54343 RepID=A0A5J5D4R7_9PERO|nr:hypothetical protein FQN60_013047 [Etheostoma spectabile]
MNVLRSIFCGYVFTAAIIMGQAISTSLSQTGESPPDNFLGFDSAPDKVVDGSVVRVRHRCSRPCQLAVEVVVSTSGETDSVVFRRKWFSGTPRVYRIQQVPLRLPPSILYQRDFFNRHVLDPNNVTVRAWLGHLNDSREPGTYQCSMLRIYKVLQIEPLSERPTKPPAGCPSWSAQLMWQMTRNRIHHCPHESDVIDMLKFPLASPGEPFGVVRRFQPFIDRALESARLRAVTQPSVTLSVWIYLLKWCHKKLCGIIHHVDRKNLYDSALMQLTDTGDVIFQARVTTGEDEAFRTSVVLPRWKWIRLDCYIQDSKVLLDATWDDETRRYEYELQNSVHYDDTDGYFVIGGSRYMPGIHGYFGPTRYYRFGTKEVKNQLHPESTLQQLDRTHQQCQEMKAFTRAFLQEVTASHVPSPINTDACSSHFISLWAQSGEKICIQTWSWEKQLKYSTLFHFLQTKEEEFRTGSLGMKDLGSTLFEQAVGSMFTVDQAQSKTTFKSMALLQVSSCFGNHKASLLLATIHLSGLGPSVDPQLQHTVEHIYLSNQEDLNSLTHETSDVFQYLKYKAEKGDIESQKRLGTMLYWGQQGVSKDVASAVKWFERSAMQMKDPSAMYDYSIQLMKGLGVKRNYTRALKLLKKAAAMFLNASRLGHVAASVEAAWYLSTGSLEGLSGDVERAVIMLKKVCEQNGHLGFMVKAALQAHLQGSRQEAFVKYVLAAETGLGLAQSNAAHLCQVNLFFFNLHSFSQMQELNLSYDCQWRYHNFSVLNHDPHPSALLKMGDHYYYSSSSKPEASSSLVDQAMSMYGRAALAGSPQGMFNLVVLAQQGHVLPLSIRGLFNVSHRDEQDIVVKILNRCVETEEEGAVTPCSLALLRVQMEKALRRMTQNRAQLLLAYASLLSVVVIIVIVPLRSCLEHRVPSGRGFALRARTSPVSQDGVNREEDGIMGGTYRATGNPWLTMLNGGQRLRQTCDLAVTLSGVCLCASWTTLLYHLL